MVQAHEIEPLTVVHGPDAVNCTHAGTIRCDYEPGTVATPGSIAKRTCFMSSIRRFTRLLLATFIGSLLAACGGGGGGGGGGGFVGFPAPPAAPTLTAIQITPAAAIRPLGLTQQYAAIATYSDGSTGDVTPSVAWKSSDPAKASIDATGLATTRSVGATTITTTLSGIGSNSATLTISPVTLLSIQVTPADTSKAVGLTQQLTATGVFSDASTADLTGAVAWVSSDTAKVSIDSQGLATTLAVGAAAISATLDRVTSNSARANVTDATLLSIAVTPPAASKPVGLSQRFTATATFSDRSIADISSSVVWTSSDPRVASISNTGLATTLSVGSIGVTASRNGVSSGVADLTVISGFLVSIRVTPASATTPIGVSQQYTATGTYTDTAGPEQDITADVSWNSNNTGTATISAGGRATAVAAGSSGISASLGGIGSYAAALTVAPATLVSIQVMPATASKTVGLSQQYHATGTYLDGSIADLTSSVAWSSSDPAKATISAGGLATAITVGPTSIRAALAGKASAPATLDVSATARAAGMMLEARAGHTATLLTDGRVLVAGGFSGPLYGAPGALASSEIYDAATGTWAATAGPMNQRRTGHTATRLADGKVLVAGGTGPSGYLASSELYDPATGAWTATGSMNDARYLHTATLLANGKVLIAAGFASADSLATSELYDPATGTWTPVGQLTTARHSHTATLLADGKVLVAGGGLGTSYLASSELYDPANGTWTPTGLMNDWRQGHTAALLADGKVLVTGGFDSGLRGRGTSDLYDPTTGTWTPTGSIGARYSHTETLLADGRVLVAGGSNALHAGNGPDGALYDPNTGTWTFVGPLNIMRDLHTATLLSDGTVLVAGGYSTGALASCELY